VFVFKFEHRLNVLIHTFGPKQQLVWVQLWIFMVAQSNGVGSKIYKEWKHKGLQIVCVNANMDHGVSMCIKWLKNEIKQYVQQLPKCYTSTSINMHKTTYQSWNSRINGMEAVRGEAC
jgi:hypothetical protein